MANEFEVSGQDDANKQKKRKLLILGGVGLVLFLAYSQGFFSDTTTQTATQQATSLDLEKARQHEVTEKKAQQDLGGLKIGGPSKERAVQVLSVQLENLKQESNANREMIQKLTTENQNFRKQMSHEMRSGLTNMQKLLSEISASRVQRDFESGLEKPPTEKLPLAGDLPQMDENGVLQPAKTRDDRPKFNYRIMGKPVKDKQKTANTSTQSKSSSLLNFNPTASSATNTESASGTEKNKETTVRPSDDQTSTNFNKVAMSDTDNRYRYEEVEVAAGSHVLAFNLHGADCPVGGSLVKDALNERAPVTMAVKDELRGANGESLDLGKVHLIGYCVGMRNSERARIKVQYLSYWGPDGKEQHVKIEGYITDKRDNRIDVSGLYVSSRTESILLASGADGLKAIADLSKASQFTNIVSPEGDTTSTFTGTVGKTAGAAAAGGALERIADMLADDAEANSDYVFIEGNIPIQLNTLKPFKLKIAVEEEYLDEV